MANGGPAPTARDLQRADTRRRLAEAALRLFAELGYDDTTVARIAADAGVTERSFFLHFPTKAEALFDLSGVDLDDLRSRILNAPPDAPDIRVLERACTEWQVERDELKHQHELSRLLLRAVASSPTLRGKQFDYNQVLVSTCAAALAERHQAARPTLPMRMAAVLAMRVLHEAYMDWAADHRPHQLRATIERRFALAYDAFGEPAPRD